MAGPVEHDLRRVHFRTIAKKVHQRRDHVLPVRSERNPALKQRRIRIATGVLLLPEHNPVLLAKQAASLDVLCGGRLTLGVGVGWSREEFASLGIPFARRGKRAAEYMRAMRALWHDDVASFDGEFVSFSAVRVNPKPVRGRRI